MEVRSMVSGRLVRLAAGPALALLIGFVGPPGPTPPAAWAVLAIAAWMALWWLTEAVPIAVTALLPLAAFPLLGVATLEAAAAPYANPLVFMFLGGFMLALAMQRWQLHSRLALLILAYAGRRPAHLVGGFMTATAVLSMWVSNTATAAMMLPIAMSVAGLVGECREGNCGDRDLFVTCMLLGVAFAANIGGMATLIGTPPNALLAGFLREAYGLEIGFAQWMAMGLPVAAALLLIAWWVLTRLLFPLERSEIAGIEALLAGRRRGLGPMAAAERRVAIVFLLTALAWIFRPWLQTLVPWLGLSDPGIAMMAGLSLFAISAGDGRALLDWESMRELPWGVLILVGGGLSLGAAMEASGLSLAVAQGLAAVADWPLWALVVLVIAAVVLVGHVTSNTATAATFIPLAAALALSVERSPLLFTVPVALAASCAYMLPVATPPNAIVFASGHLRVSDMVRAGALLSIAAVGLVAIAAMVVVPRVLA